MDNLLYIVVETAFGQEVYPRIRKVIVDCFKENQRTPVGSTRVQLYDQDAGEVIDDFRLED